MNRRVRRTRPARIRRTDRFNAARQEPRPQGGTGTLAGHATKLPPHHFSGRPSCNRPGEYQINRLDAHPRASPAPTRSFTAGLVIDGFLRDDNVVGVAFPEPARSDADKARLLRSSSSDCAPRYPMPERSPPMSWKIVSRSGPRYGTRPSTPSATSLPEAFWP